MKATLVISKRQFEDHPLFGDFAVKIQNMIMYSGEWFFSLCFIKFDFY